jgi:predicted nucleic acid-binding protein
VAAKWFLDEDLCDEARRVLHTGYSLHAPDFLLLEMDSIFLKRVRRGDITLDDADDARLMFSRVPIARHTFTTYLDSAFAIANETGQSIYDCLYVALAVLLRARMVTADRRLYEGIRNGRFKKHIGWIEDIK